MIIAAATGIVLTILPMPTTLTFDDKCFAGQISVSVEEDVRTVSCA